MKQLTIEGFRGMLTNALKHIKAREDEFSKLDAVIGDGDHGQAIVTAFSVVVKASEKGTEFKSMLNDMGFGVMLETSGSTSTLLGAFFLGMSDNAAGTELDDKTMMDALIPAIEAIEASTSDDIKEVMTAGAEAALQGAEQTVNMKANFGRARNYGERSIGYADSGATSWSCMLAAFAEAL